MLRQAVNPRLLLGLLLCCSTAEPPKYPLASCGVMQRGTPTAASTRARRRHLPSGRDPAQRTEV